MAGNASFSCSGPQPASIDAIKRAQVKATTTFLIRINFPPNSFVLIRQLPKTKRQLVRLG